MNKKRKLVKKLVDALDQGAVLTEYFSDYKGTNLKDIYRKFKKQGDEYFIEYNINSSYENQVVNKKSIISKMIFEPETILVSFEEKMKQQIEDILDE